MTMGKIDDMRRLREQKFDDAARRQARKPAVAVEPPAETAKVTPDDVADPVTAPAPAATPAPRAKAPRADAPAASEAEEGKCSGCGKVKPMKNGLLVQHQKGFGKACTGSRKAPV